MMVDENYVKNNFSGKESFFAVSNQRCFFLEQLNNYAGSQRGLGLQGSGLENPGLQGSKTKISGL